MNLTFDAQELRLWPAMQILTQSRKKASPRSLVRIVKDVLRPHTFRVDRDVDPGELKSPATTEQILKWIESVWKRLESAEHTTLLERRRSILQQIVESSLSAEEQSRLLAALDYLFRLCAARNLARSSGPGDMARIPHTGNRSMQAVYQKLAGLAATDLPVWLNGERGTELEWLARLVHRLRGLPETTFHAWDSGRSWSTALSDLRDELGPDATIFLRGIDEFPQSFQKMLYRHLMTELSCPASFRIMVSSGPLDLSGPQVTGMIAELLAFLNPMRVDIPPLRNRTDDIPAFIRFFTASRRETDPIDRFDPQALEVLRNYHWPGNLAELEVTLAFCLKKRPAGRIRVEDLPDTIRPATPAPARLLELLEANLRDEGFRVLRSEQGRRALAEFLDCHQGTTFGAGDAQRFFGLGRETARRLLRSLADRGLIEGFTGAEGKRVTRYRVAERPAREREFDE